VFGKPLLFSKYTSADYYYYYYYYYYVISETYELGEEGLGHKPCGLYFTITFVRNKFFAPVTV
jgi:hypothetical protein